MTIGSAATSSTFKHGSVFKYLRESSGLRGPSIARTAVEAKRTKRNSEHRRERGISVFDFFKQLECCIDEHFARAGFYASVGDFVAALGKCLICRHVAWTIVADGNHDGFLEWR